jgi:hypothetical protein
VLTTLLETELNGIGATDAGGDAEIGEGGHTRLDWASGAILVISKGADDRHRDGGGPLHP